MNHADEKLIGQDLREDVRQKIFKTFYVYLDLPQLGFTKVKIDDLSKGGLAFSIPRHHNIKLDDSFQSYLLINDNVRLPINLTIVHLKEENFDLKVGCRIIETDSVAFKAVNSFIEFLMAVSPYLNM